MINGKWGRKVQKENSLLNKKRKTSEIINISNKKNKLQHRKSSVVKISFEDENDLEPVPKLNKLMNEISLLEFEANNINSINIYFNQPITKDSESSLININSIPSSESEVSISVKSKFSKKSEKQENKNYIDLLNTTQSSQDLNSKNQELQTNLQIPISDESLKEYTIEPNLAKILKANFPVTKQNFCYLLKQYCIDNNCYDKNTNYLLIYLNEDLFKILNYEIIHTDKLSNNVEKFLFEIKALTCLIDNNSKISKEINLKNLKDIKGQNNNNYPKTIPKPSSLTSKKLIQRNNKKDNSKLKLFTRDTVLNRNFFIKDSQLNLVKL